MELQTALNTIATDIFRKQADYDYIAARASYRMRLRQQFLWSAHQAVEKYLKAILLFNSKSARFYTPTGRTKQKEFSHNLAALLLEVRSIQLFEIELGPKGEEFFSYLSSQGVNRYLSASAYSMADAIQQLDQLVWHIRRYCQYISSHHEAIPGMQEAILRSITAPSTKRMPQLLGGELEAVVRRDPKDSARKALVWANLWYCNKRRHRVTYDAFSSFEITPSEREWQGIDWETIEYYVKP
ncbi:hypothetical protein BXU06_16650 [Aquaspirillum sp. LM1]|jgi:HEPN domain|uniref:HEPN domain-containing protein n=1 Tax=Aquaspirillum sp. LM1 TaxID=1938604 RepID=UPI000983E63F|nr:HEPN domain-containing protein [Aquaspirillum sp. LM1]AQR66498.1 hypothetical protein BXU06_16650 [Aquaspirillum sp. LM1]